MSPLCQVNLLTGCRFSVEMQSLVFMHGPHKLGLDCKTADCQSVISQRANLTDSEQGLKPFAHCNQTMHDEP